MDLQDAEHEGPETVPSRFVEAWNARDTDGIAALFEKDAEFVNVTGLWWHERNGRTAVSRHNTSYPASASTSVSLRCH
jgi:uncharacterized protein (TIGR02246 family)